jgi:hypothetical protein
MKKLIILLLYLAMVCSIAFGANEIPVQGENTNSWGTDLNAYLQKGQGWYDVRAYGATGDGSTDDTTAIQAALDAAYDSTGEQTVYFPSGRYVVTTNALTYGTTAGRPPAAAKNKLTIIGSGPSTEIVQTTANIDLFQIGKSDVTTNGFAMKNMSISCVDGTGTTLKLTRVSYFNIDNVNVRGGGQYGIHGEGVISCSFNDLRATTATPELFTVTTAPTDAWVRFEDQASPAFGANQITLTNPIISATVANKGLDLDGCQSVTIIGGTFEQSKADYVINGLNCTGIKLLGSHFEENDGFGVKLDGCDGGEIRPSVCASTTFTLVACEDITLGGALGSKSGENTVNIDEDCFNCNIDDARITGPKLVYNHSRTTTMRNISNDVTARAYGEVVPCRFPVLLNPMSEWNGSTTPWRLTKLDTPPTFEKETTIKMSGDASLKIITDAAGEGVYFDLESPDTDQGFVGQWLYVEAWIHLDDGDVRVSYTPSAAGPTHTLTAQELVVCETANGTDVEWCRFSGSFRNTAISNGFGADGRISITNKTDTTSTFYIGALNIYSETNGWPTDTTLASTDATPDTFGNPYYQILRTANGAGTTITTFDNAVYGAEVLLLIEDGNTTIDFTGTNLKGNAGADWSPADGDAMRCRFDGTNWYCTIIDTTA